MLTRADIEKFYQAVEELNLKFPIAVIAKETGFSKGNVSDYLKKRRDPSENFLKAFYSKFHKGSQKVQQDGRDYKAEFHAILDRYLKLSDRIEELQTKLNLVLTHVEMIRGLASSGLLDPGRLPPHAPPGAKRVEPEGTIPAGSPDFPSKSDEARDILKKIREKDTSSEKGKPHRRQT